MRSVRNIARDLDFLQRVDARLVGIERPRFSGGDALFGDSANGGPEIGWHGVAGLARDRQGLIGDVREAKLLTRKRAFRAGLQGNVPGVKNRRDPARSARHTLVCRERHAEVRSRRGRDSAVGVHHPGLLFGIVAASREQLRAHVETTRGEAPVVLGQVDPVRGPPLELLVHVFQAILAGVGPEPPLQIDVWWSAAHVQAVAADLVVQRLKIF